MKVLVIGLDGVSWNILDELIKEGLMPNLENLRKNSIWGDLGSCIPPVTFPAWKCYSTSRDPSQLEVYWWMNVDFINKRFVVNNSLSFKGKDIWDYLSEKGMKSIVINMPGTYPAKKINGIMIAGPPNPSLEKSVYPRHLLIKLKLTSYRTMPQAKWSLEGVEVIRECREIHHKLFKLALSLMRQYRWNFFQITFVLTDPILHHFWEYHKNLSTDNEIAIELRKFWSELDQYIGQLVNEVSKEGYVFILSDHGMVEMKCKVYINNILMQEGYLKLKKSKYLISKLHLYIPKKTVGQILAKMHLLDPVTKILQKVGTLEKFNPARDLELSNELVDWERTKALNLSDVVALIYTHNVRDKEIEDLILLLNSLKYNGERIFDRVYHSYEIYEEVKEGTPRIIAVPREGYEIAPGLARKTFKDSKHDVWKATHRMNGMFIIYSEQVSSKKMHASIYDIAPTILSLLSVPEEKFVNEMKGRMIAI